MEASRKACLTGEVHGSLTSTSLNCLLSGCRHPPQPIVHHNSADRPPGIPADMTLAPQSLGCCAPCVTESARRQLPTLDCRHCTQLFERLGPTVLTLAPCPPRTLLGAARTPSLPCASVSCTYRFHNSLQVHRVQLCASRVSHNSLQVHRGQPCASRVRVTTGSWLLRCPTLPLSSCSALCCLRCSVLDIPGAVADDLSDLLLAEGATAVRWVAAVALAPLSQ